MTVAYSVRRPFVFDGREYSIGDVLEQDVFGSVDKAEQMYRAGKVNRFEAPARKKPGPKPRVKAPARKKPGPKPRVKIEE